MNVWRKGYQGSMLAVVLVLGALLGACGTDSPSGSTVTTVSGVVTAGTPTVGLKTCTSCHPTETAAWMLTKHANVEPLGDLYSQGNPTIGQITAGPCTACHDPQGDSGQLTADYTGNRIRPVVGCESCHSGGQMHVAQGGIGPIGYTTMTATVAGTTPSTIQVSGQYRTCTACHELLDTTAADPANTAATPVHKLAQAPTDSAYYITDTHFATPGDWSGIGGANVKAITGYVMDFASEKVCIDCHNPHKAPTQNREWAQSAHGDKNPLNLNSTQTGYFSGAWAHYNWSQATRTTCQRCHTTTGFAAYSDALRTGNRAQATLISTGTASPPPLLPNTAFKPEMLKCNGCHTDNKGTLRNPGAITATYNYTVTGQTKPSALASHTYPDLAGSNVCMACHTGLESGDTIKGLNDPVLLNRVPPLINAFNYTNSSFINSHYLTAGGQVFTVTGYEFEGRPYNNIPEFLHDKIGTPATIQLAPYVNTGSNGPCIGCHMSRPNNNGNHLFLPVSRSTVSYGEITGIASEMCMRCHGPSPTLILDLVKEQKRQYMGSIEAFKDQLELKRAYYFSPNYPYFFTNTYNPAYVESGSCSSNLAIKNWQTGGNSTYTWSGTACTSAVNSLGTAETGQNNMGAAFNFNLLEHDPGAYVHNRMYVKRLIYDSIDWVDDGVMNYSVGATLAALTTEPYKAEAMVYLLPNGVLGFEAERP